MALHNATTTEFFLGITDEAQARAFYGEVLGLQELPAHHPEVLTFQVGSVHLFLSKVPKLAPHPFTVLNWQVEDLDATQAKLKAKGVSFTDYSHYGMEQDANLVWTTPDGTRIAWFNDPFGNVLSISQVSQ